MKKRVLIYIACLLLVSEATLGDGNHSFGQTYNNTSCGLNYVQSSKMITTRYTLTPGCGFPCTLPISGIPSCYVVDKAYIYWIVSYEGVSSTTPTVSLTNPSGVTSNYSGTLIGSDVPKCWGEVGTRAFRADITPAITGTGNGTYTINNIAGNTVWEVDGATLIIIYRDLSATWKGSLIIDDGVMTYNNVIDLTFSHTITGFTACGSGSNSTAFLIASDLQNNVGSTFNATCNGTTGTFPKLFWNFAQVSTTVDIGQASSSYSLIQTGDCFAVCAASLYFQTTTCGSCASTVSVSAIAGANPVCAGTAVTFTATSTNGGSTPSYQWQVNGVNQGANSSAYTYTPVNSDAVSCVLTSNATCVTGSPATSNTVTMTVNPLPTATVSGGGTVCTGSTLPNVSIVLTGTAPWSLTYSINGVAQTLVTGITTSPYVFTSPSAGTYTLTALHDANCTGTSFTGSGIVTVNPLPTGIVSGGGTVCAGVTLPNVDITLTGTEPWSLTYSINGVAQTPVTGITTSPYVFTSPSAGTYILTALHDANCTGTSFTGSAMVTVNSLPTATVSGGGTVCAGTTLPNVSITLTGTAPWALTYSINDVAQTPVTGITTSPYVFTSPSAGTYTLTALHDANCTGTSFTGSAIVTVNPLPTATVSGGGTVCAGVTLPNVDITMTGTAWSLTYSINGVNQTTVTGIATSPYIITGAGAGTYTVTALSDANCTGTSFTGSAIVTVNPLPTATVSGGGTVCAGVTLPNVDITMTGTAPWALTYSINDVNQTTVTGIATSPYIITGAGAGTYTVTALSDANCTGTSFMGNAIVTVNPLPTGIVSGGGTVCAGTTLPNVSITLTGTAPWALTYAINDVAQTPVTGITTSPYVFTSPSAGTYTLTALHDANCTGTSFTGSGIVTVNPLPTGIVSGGGTVNVDITLTGTEPWSLTYSINGVAQTPVTGITTSPYVFTSPSAGTYILTALHDANCTGTSFTGSAMVTVNSLPTATVSGGGTVCAGTTLPNVSITLTGTAPWALTYSINDVAQTPVTGITTSPYVFTSPSAGTYTLTALHDANCTGTSFTGSAIVTVNPLPTATVSGGGTVCAGVTLPNVDITMTGTAWSLTYSINGVNQTTVTGIATSPYIITGAGAGTYTVTALSDANCTGTSFTGSAIVTVNPLPTGIVSGGGTVCAGTTLPNVSITLTGTAPWALTYAINDVAQTLVTGITTSPYVFTSPSAGTYTLTALHDANCTGTSFTGSAIITVNPLPILTDRNRNICLNDTAVLIVYGAATYFWNTGGTSDTLNVKSQPAGTYIYTVTGTDNKGCKSDTTATVTVHNLPVLKINNGKNDTLCSGETAILTATGATDYIWSTGINSDNIQVSPVINTTYSVTGSDQYGCTDIATAVVIVVPNPVVQVNGDTIICSGGCTKLTATGALNYKWNNGRTTDSITVCPKNLIIYTVVGTDKNGCTGTGNAIVTVNPAPVAKFSATPQNTTILNPNIQFIDLTQGNIVSWQWDLGDSATEILQSFMHEYKSIGKYKVRLLVTNNFDCSDTTSECVVISVPPCYMYIPNAFSPEDVENTTNMVFKVYIDPDVTVDGFKLSVFNRWGALIFETSDINKGWDGTFNGNLVPEGVYVYMVNYIGCNGRTDDAPIYGAVTLLRKRHSH